VSVVADLMDLDERSVRRGIERGDLPGIRVGSAIRIPVAALARLAEIDLEDSEAVSATDTAARSDLRPLKAIRHGNFDARGG
jgi:hypothetical protein